MLEKMLKLYTMYMAYDVRSPMPHVVGPPGCGKSQTMKQLAQILDVKLHTINVSRISPLELEGVQMPHGEGEALHLKLLTATFWTQLREGDILLMDEFLRGFPEVYNGLLDIFTSREVAGFTLPKVFIVGASNSTVSYDKALEDRLLHLPVADIRTNKKAKSESATILCEALGLMPQVAGGYEMQTLLDSVVAPMYKILDSFKKKSSSAPGALEGRSLRNLIGQAQLREIEEPALRELIDSNNRLAMSNGKPQFVLLPDAKKATLAALQGYESKAKALVGNDKLSELQAKNLNLNLQLIEMESIRHNSTKGTTADDDDDSIFLDLD